MVFFSSQTCKLGRHAPIAKTQRDGIFRIGKKYAEKVANEDVDSWFSEIGKNYRRISK